ncbi:hypothetical protein Syun_014400 [Stephania yunnanensis]|uniref:Uncharacterized protein n=1 Tax=Stephania yunnanensis TaxID=152371 RepID=A0AAP0PBT1_9MAGN
MRITLSSSIHHCIYIKPWAAPIEPPFPSPQLYHIFQRYPPKYQPSLPDQCTHGDNSCTQYTTLSQPQAPTETSSTAQKSRQSQHPNGPPTLQLKPTQSTQLAFQSTQSETPQILLLQPSSCPSTTPYFSSLLAILASPPTLKLH